MPEPNLDAIIANAPRVEDIKNEQKPVYPLLTAHHDCVSLASAWGLGRQSQEELDLYISPDAEMRLARANRERTMDGKSNKIVVACPGFRNELGGEPKRHLALVDCNECEKDYAPNETWHRELVASEVSVLEDVSNVYLGGRLCAERQNTNIIEPQPLGAHYYRHCFAGHPHFNYLGVDETGEPMAVSIAHEIPSRDFSGQSHLGFFRLIVRRGYREPLRLSIPESFILEKDEQKTNRQVLRALMELTDPTVNLNHLHSVPLTRQFEEDMITIDEQPLHRQHKIGLLYCAREQCTEIEMYNNEDGSKDYNDFLEFLGQKVALKGFTSYAGGLDTEKMTCGTHSIHAEYQADEIMFHVSTLLPYSSSNRQQLSRKRHVGNDMVTVIFQDKGALPFTPSTVQSQFQRVFIIIRVNEESTNNDITYSMAVSRDQDLPAFGPMLPSCAIFQRSRQFKDFLLAKIINAEEAAARSPKFRAYAARNRRESLKSLVRHYILHPEKSVGLTSRLLQGSLRRKTHEVMEPIMSADIRGAFSWSVIVYDFSQEKWIRSVMGISMDSIVLFDIQNGLVLFSTPSRSVVGWTGGGKLLKIYYDHGQMLLLMFDKAYGPDGMATAVKRLEVVSKTVPATDVFLRRFKESEPMGFHYVDEGVVTDVELYRDAWTCGLRQGCRIVEIEKKPIIALTSEEIKVYLLRSNAVQLLVIPPADDGSPRRGCEDPNCPCAKGNEHRLLTFDNFAISYDEARRTSRFAGQVPGPSRGETDARLLDEDTEEEKTTPPQKPSFSRSLQPPRAQASGNAEAPMEQQPAGSENQPRMPWLPEGPQPKPWLDELLAKDASYDLISEVSRDKLRLEKAITKLRTLTEENRRLMECVSNLTAEVNREKVEKERALESLAKYEPPAEPPSDETPMSMP